LIGTEQRTATGSVVSNAAGTLNQSSTSRTRSTPRVAAKWTKEKEHQQQG